MKRRSPVTLAVLVVTLLLLLPSLAWADGSDTSAFERYAAQSPLVAAAMSFAFGFTSALTPCVFPMIPITVAIFGATESPSRLRGAALSGTFVLGIACLFTPLGVGAALSGQLMGSALANPWVVGVLAIVFLALASSMFGAFEMALPSGLNNKLSSVGGVGFKGAFVLGLVMGLVAAPCTGPFMTGMITWIATKGNVALGAVCMFSFALGLGILFFVAGTFAVNLPKGGAWMMGIKWASGVGLAYMAFAYIRDSNPALAKKVILPSTTFGVGVGALFLVGLALGAVHVMAERRKSPIARYSRPSKLASIVPAVAGAFLFISWMGTSKPLPVDPNAPKIEWAQKEAADAVFAKATTDKKPVMIDFGASWCKACMELEEHTFPDARVRTEASRYAALHVDATDDDDATVKKLQGKYGVRGLPTVILLDSAGQEKARFTEFVAPDKFVEALKKVN